MGHPCLPEFAGNDETGLKFWTSRPKANGARPNSQSDATLVGLCNGYRSAQPVLRSPKVRARRRAISLPGEFSSPPRGGRGPVVPACAKFDAAADETKIEAVDEAAVAALLAKVSHARPSPLAIADDAIDYALGHDTCSFMH